jgi:Cys-tRNA(Pro) deacylase
MGKRVTQTPATKWLAAQGIEYTEHVYDYVDRGGAAEGARQLGLELPAVIKTLVMQDAARQPLIVLMHGDREVSTRNLAREVGIKTISPCDPAVAQRHSGYQVGGTSPFGLRKNMPVYVEASILDLPGIYINGGRRGYLLGIRPEVLTVQLGASPVNCAQR